MKHGEIWRVNFEPQTGQEIKKTRPALIISNDLYFKNLPFRIVVPLRDTKPHHRKTKLFVVIDKDEKNGLSKTSTADCAQVRSFDKARFIEPLGVIDATLLQEIKDTVALCISVF